jgi:hypothetical protein
MGRSANKLKSTKSGVVSPNLFFALTILFNLSALLRALRVSALSFLSFFLLPLSLYVLTSFLPLPAPPPPLTFFRRQPRILRLCHGCAIRIQHTRILSLSPNSLHLFIHPLRILLRQLLDAANPQKLKIPQHRRPDGDQIS